MEYKIYRTDELTHHGIKGMKWGIRRFQNKDGSLTKAGIKRRAKLETELKQLGGRSKRSDGVDEAPRKKTIAEMTDDELRARTNRMRVEKEYYDAQKNLALANPVQVSKGQKFMKSLMGDVIAPAAKSAGKEWAEKFLKDKLGLNEKDSVAQLEKQWKKLDYQKKIRDLKDDLTNPKREKVNWDDRIKEQNYIKEQKKTAEAQKEFEEYLRNLRREQDDD